MGKILEFIPKDRLDAQDNLTAFIEHCRYELHTFGKDLEWDSDRWSLGYKARGKCYFESIVWRNWDTTKGNKGKVLQEPFIHFAKAFVRYRYALTQKTTTKRFINAFRALERVLVTSPTEISITSLNDHHFDAASQLIKKRFKGSSEKYHDGQRLEEISKFLVEKRICRSQLSWRNPIQKNSDKLIRIGKKYDSERKAKLPDPDALELLFKSFHIATQDRDIVIASTAALMLCNSCRISEVLTLPANCEVELQATDGTIKYGLQWLPAKGGEPMVKWVYPSMIEVAKKALRNIRKCSAKAREIAKFYEDNSDKLFLNKKYSHYNDEEWLLILDLEKALEVKRPDGKYTSAIRQFVSKNPKIRTKKIKGRRYIKMKDLAKENYKCLPKGFPYLDKPSGLKYSEALLIFQQHYFKGNQHRMNYQLQAFTHGIFGDGLGAKKKPPQSSSIFYRLGFEDDAANLKYTITSHQFRHLQDTIMHRGGLSQLDIAKAAGRTNIQQNETYDHLSADDLIGLLEEHTGGQVNAPILQAANSLTVNAEANSPITREAFLKLNIPTAHVTEFGFCVHDYTMSPCEKFRDCINCTEHFCIKGDKAKAERIRFQLSVVEKQLINAEKAMSEGEYGADRWYEKHKKTHERLKALVDALDDHTVPEGAVIQLSGINEFKPASAALKSARLLPDNDSETSEL